MKVRLPARAPEVPPETGVSMKVVDEGRKEAMVLDVLGEMVEASTMSFGNGLHCESSL